MLLPMMIAAGHSPGRSAGLIASAGIIAPVVPPSIGFVVFGVAANVSISKLFFAGIFPGLMLAATLWVTWWWLARTESIPTPPRKPISEVFTALRQAGWALVLPFIIIVGLKMGVFTPTEAGVVAAVYALFVSTIVYRELPISKLYSVLVASARTSAIVMFLVAAAAVSAWLITVANIPGEVVTLLSPLLDSPKLLILLAPEPTEAEHLVDRPLELQRLLLALGIVGGQPAQPVRAHLHVGHLVGEHPVFREVQDRVGQRLAEVPHGLEDVDGQALQRPVDAGQAEDGIRVAGGLVEQRLLGELADGRPHVLRQLAGDLDVASLVPALPRHVELEGQGGVLPPVARLEVPAGATGTLERLDLAHEDAVHERAGVLAGVLVGRRERVDAGTRAGVAGVEDDLLDAHVVEPLVAGQLGHRQHPLHVEPPLRVGIAAAQTTWAAPGARARTTTARRTWPGARPLEGPGRTRPTRRPGGALDGRGRTPVR